MCEMSSPCRRNNPRLAGLLLLLTFLTLQSKTVADQVKTSNDTLLWGPYRPNVYFGVRPRLPKSIFAGLIWSNVDTAQLTQASFRHTCEQDEGMAGYGWDEYDIGTGGRQTIKDAGSNVDITTEFAKSAGGEHGGNWGARIKGAIRPGAPAATSTTVILYVGLEGLGELQVNSDYDELGYKGDLQLLGTSQGLGGFQIKVTEGPSSNRHPNVDHPASPARPLDRTMARGLMIQQDALWRSKELFIQELAKSLDDYKKTYGEDNMPAPPLSFSIGTNDQQAGNFHLIQKTFAGDFEFDILFSSASAPQQIDSEKLTKLIKENSKQFNERHAKSFEAQPPFTGPKYDEFSKAMFSNLLGGVGYFHGDQMIDRSGAPEYDEDNEGFWENAAEAIARNEAKLQGSYELFTAVPSRPFFPRGFLWDEGFHVMPFLDWDLGLTVEILRSWFRTMDDDGWIPREQILGPEARSKVPAEFQTQYPHYANPPTLFLVIEGVLDKLAAASMSKAEMDGCSSILRSMYPLMKRHYAWYRTTQRGDLKTYPREGASSKEAYRWKGRTPTHLLTSGLDDYPRAQPPHPGELHIDLISWMGMMSRSMKRVASHLGETEDADDFAKHQTAIARNIDNIHWDEKNRAYCDATIDDYEEDVLVCHKGYISIFPLLTGLLQADSPHLGEILDLIGDEDELWSPHGIRSLSKKDPLYGTGENYWRSPVWMNINYLVLDNLLSIAQARGAHQDKSRKLYSQLRINLVNTVYDSWKETGFAWEQFHPETGKGQRTQHFTGWTSLVVKMMTMPDLSGKTAHEEL